MRTLVILAIFLTAACAARPSAPPATSTSSVAGAPSASVAPAPRPAARGSYAKINGLEMYYEVHGAGAGRPLVLLHGAFCTIEGCFGELLPALAARRKVIAVELQGHGRTADSDRPLRATHMADDTDALLAALGIPEADVLGYSMGAAVALHLAIRHPARVGKLVLVSPAFNRAGFQPGLLEMIGTIKPEMFHGSPMHQAYLDTAPHPDHWPRFVEKIKEMNREVIDVPPASIQRLQEPVLLVAGDADMARPEHVIELFRLVGGGAMGDMVGPQRSQLAILPGTHHMGIISKQKEIAVITAAFLDAPPVAPPAK